MQVAFKGQVQNLDSGLEYRLNDGLDYGLDYGLDRTVNSVLSAEDHLMLDCPMSWGLAKQQKRTCVHAAFSKTVACWLQPPTPSSGLARSYKMPNVLKLQTAS